MKYSIVTLALSLVVEATPFARPQGVTAAISPPAPAPSGCLPAYGGGMFGIAVMNATEAAAVGAQPDGQPTAGGAAVSTISDGQPQAPKTTGGIAPVSQIPDGQIQASTKTVVGVSQISDGQIQATTKTMLPINQIGDGQIQNQKPKQTLAPISQISDGQIQATKTAAPVSQISDGQIQASKTAGAVSQISDGQIQASKTNAVGTMADGQPTASAGATGSGSSSGSSTGGTSYVACKKSDSLQITLDGGVLKDNQGRTGYIASNFQFQFDGPPQAGALYTAGFSTCGNGTLSLGGSSTFYQCLSGDFYNLYDRHWAPQCSPVHIQTVQLVTC